MGQQLVERKQQRGVFIWGGVEEEGLPEYQLRETVSQSLSEQAGFHLSL